MNYYFITGTSKGLGKSLAETLLKEKNNFVYGFSRSDFDGIHDNYSHNHIDLSDTEMVKQYKFPDVNNADKIVLINNAGTLGEVKHVGNLSPSIIISSYNVNLISPSILINTFIKKYRQINGNKMIINISSGAGKSAIDGWSVYCSTKAGLDMFSKVISEEARINNSNFTVLSIAPGIIDTNMQSEIRSTDNKNFSNLDRFIEYKKNSDLSSPEHTANKVLQYINNPDLANDILCSVRDL